MVTSRNVVSSSNVTSGTSFTTSSQTFTAGLTYLFGFSIRNGASTNPSAPTVTGGGCTWSSVGSTSNYDDSGTSRRTLFLYEGVCTTTTTGQLTADFGAVTHTGMIYTIDEFFWADTSDPVVQSASNRDTSGTASTLTVTLAAFGSSNNATYAVFCNGNDSATTTAGSGFTKLGDFTESNANVSGRLSSEFKTGNDTGADITYSLTAQLGGIAVEIKAATSYEIATDNFNRADGGLGTNWSNAPDEGQTPTISSNQVTSSGAGDAVAYWSANTFHTDQYSQATMSTIDRYLGLVVRANASDVVYGQQNPTADLVIYWYNAGAYTQIGSTYTTTGWSNGDVARMEVNGPTYSLYQNGVRRVTGINASAPKIGSPGLIVNTTTERVDDWSGGNLYANGIIAFGSATEDPSSGTIDVSLTIPTGYTNLVLVVATRIRDATDADRNITGITWNTSEALTQAKEQNNDTYDITSEQWYRVNPTTGTHTVSVTTAGVVSVSRVTAICLAGIAQTGLPDASSGTDAATGQPSLDITTITDGCIVIDSLYTKDSVAPTAGTGQLPLDSTTVNAGGNAAAVSYERKATAGAVTMSWTQNITTEQWVMTAVSYPLATAGSSSQSPSLSPSSSISPSSSVSPSRSPSNSPSLSPSSSVSPSISPSNSPSLSPSSSISPSNSPSNSPSLSPSSSISPSTSPSNSPSVSPSVSPSLSPSSSASPSNSPSVSPSLSPSSSISPSNSPSVSPSLSPSSSISPSVSPSVSPSLSPSSSISPSQSPSNSPSISPSSSISPSISPSVSPSISPSLSPSSSVSPSLSPSSSVSPSLNPGSSSNSPSLSPSSSISPSLSPSSSASPSSSTSSSASPSSSYSPSSSISPSFSPSLSPSASFSPSSSISPSVSPSASASASNSPSPSWSADDEPSTAWNIPTEQSQTWTPAVGSENSWESLSDNTVIWASVSPSRAPWTD